MYIMAEDIRNCRKSRQTP